MKKVPIFILLISFIFQKVNGQSDSVIVRLSIDSSINKKILMDVEICTFKLEPIKICDSIRYGEFVCNTSCLIMAFQVLHKDCFENRTVECAFPVYSKPKILKAFTKEDTIHLKWDITDYFDHVIKSTGKICYVPNTYRFGLIFNYYSLRGEEKLVYSKWHYINFE